MGWRIGRYEGVLFFFSSRRRHTRSSLVSWARRCVKRQALNLADKLLTLQKKVTKFDGIEADLQTLYYRLDKVLTEKKTD